MQIESAETGPSASVGDCYYMAAVNLIQMPTFDTGVFCVLGSSCSLV